MPDQQREVMKMDTNSKNATFMDSVNDTIDVILDEPLMALGKLVLPVLCFAVVFLAGSAGFFDAVLPNAGWGLLTMMSGALYAALMVAAMYAKGQLAAPEAAECGASK